MAVPDFQKLMLPLLKLASDGEQHTYAKAIERLAEEFRLSEDDKAQLLRSGQTRLYNRVGWATTYLKNAGLLQGAGRGRFQLTDRGRDVLAGHPATIDVAFLEARFPEMSEFRKARPKVEAAAEEPSATFNAADGTWSQRPGVEERVRETIELSIPNELVSVRAPRSARVGGKRVGLMPTARRNSRSPCVVFGIYWLLFGWRALKASNSALESMRGINTHISGLPLSPRSSPSELSR